MECLEGTRGFNFWPVNDPDICNPDIHDFTKDHGTMVAGIIGAEDEDIGVARKVKILPIRILSDEGTGCLADAIAAWGLIIKINKFYEKTQPNTREKIVIVNNSYGFGSGDLKNVGLGILKFVVQRTSEEGLLLIASAGDDGNDINDVPHYPASIVSDNLIAVAATDNDDKLVKNCSNWGQKKVQLGAPGFNIWTTSTSITGFGNFDCTSAAAAFVSGGAAIIKSNCPDLDNRSIKNYMLNGADNIEGLKTDIEGGRRMNIAKAVKQCSKNKPLFTINGTDYFIPRINIFEFW